MVKRFKNFLLCVLLLNFSFFCFSESKVLSLNGPSSVPFAYFSLFENTVQDESSDDALKSDLFTTDFVSSLDEFLLKLNGNEIAFCAVPVVLLADVLNYLDFSYSCIGFYESSSLYVVSTDSKINNIADLFGKNIRVYGKQSVSNKFLQWILNQNEIPLSSSSNGVYISAVNSRENIISSLITNRNFSAIISEPDVSIVLKKNKSLKKVVDLQREYSAIKGNDYVLPVSVIIANNDLLENNKEILVTFEEKFSYSIKQMKQNPRKIMFLSKDIDLGIDDNVMIEAIQNMNFEYVNSNYEDMVVNSMKILNRESYNKIKNNKIVYVPN